MRLIFSETEYLLCARHIRRHWFCDNLSGDTMNGARAKALKETCIFQAESTETHQLPWLF